MSEKIRLGVTRNRLFEFENAVTFCGDFPEEYDSSCGVKAMKMLCAKYPLLSGVIDICDDGEAYVYTGRAVPVIEEVNAQREIFIADKRRQGVDFTQTLFEFYVLNGKTLVIFGHTAVSDVRALMILASEFLDFYNRNVISVEECPVDLFSEMYDLPSNVFSPVVTRLASDLSIGWQKKTRVFTTEDYKKARNTYSAQRGESYTLSKVLPASLMEKLSVFSEINSVDISSVVAYCFYESLVNTLGGKLKYKKLNVQANERLFFDRRLAVGPYNGFVAVNLIGGKSKSASQVERAVLFHNEIYKKVTSSFSVFYIEGLCMRLEGAFCDSAHMCSVDEFKHKYSKKLAEIYGCLNEVAGEFVSLNISQRYWERLRGFSAVFVSEPAKMRASSLVTFVQGENTGEVTFEFKEKRISREQGAAIMDKAMSLLEMLVKSE